MLRTIRGAVSLAAFAAVCMSAQASYTGGSDVTNSPGGTVSGPAATAKTLYEQKVQITATETFGTGLQAGVSADGFVSASLNATIRCISTDPFGGPGVNTCSLQNSVTEAASDGGRFDTTDTSSTSGTFLRSDPNFTQQVEKIYFNFENAFSAFGFFYTDLGDFLGGSEVTVYTGLNGTGAVETYQLADSGDSGSLGFFGFYNSDTTAAYKSFSISMPYDGGRLDDIFGVDDVFVGVFTGDDQQVPEPTTIALLGASLLVASRFQRRRKSSQ